MNKQNGGGQNAKKKYSDYFKDPQWQRKRLEIFERDDFKCMVCMDATNQLHVHHKQYLPGNKPWEYEDNWLITLCASCHDKFHEKFNIKPKNVRKYKNEIDTSFLGFREFVSDNDIHQNFDNYDLLIEYYKDVAKHGTLPEFLEYCSSKMPDKLHIVSNDILNYLLTEIYWFNED
jgi:hypothetical protein